jgi:sigma-B regulation protein RsbU (phosphoserine phosphatase)
MRPAISRVFSAIEFLDHTATAFYGVFDPATRRLKYANAGHCPPWLIRGGTCQRLESLTPPLGMFPSVDSLEKEVELEGDDWLVVASDGITEAADENGEDFGDMRLLALLDTPGMTTEAFCRSALDAVTSFAGNKQADDVTIMAARILTANAGE